MKRRLGLFSESGDIDPSSLLPVAERRALPAGSVGVISVIAADDFVAALAEAIEGVVVASVPGATASEVDAELDAAIAGGTKVIACGESVVGRYRVDLLIAIDGGRPLARRPAAFRHLSPEADLLLSEPRLGVAAELGRVVGDPSSS